MAKKKTSASKRERKKTGELRDLSVRGKSAKQVKGGLASDYRPMRTAWW
jgi:hypothetical protein